MGIEAAAIIGGSSLLGGLFGGRSAARAAETQAAAQREAAQIAAEEARFRPVGITTRFGRSMFDYSVPGLVAPVEADYILPPGATSEQVAEATQKFKDAQAEYATRLAREGRVSGAGYELSPEFRAYQERLLGLAGRGLTQAEMGPQQFAPLAGAGASLFGLGQQYLAETPEQVAAKYMTGQQALLAPSRERQLSQLQNTLFQQGRSGLSVGATGTRPGGGMGLGAASPEMEAYYNALAQQDAALAAQAQQAGQQQLAFGTGLFGTGAQMYDLYGRGQVGALAPYQAYLGGATGLESLGQQPLELGSALGGRIASPTGAQALLTGLTGAARTQGAADAYNPFATALQGFAQSPDVRRGLESYFKPPTTGNAGGYGYGGFGTGYGFGEQDLGAFLYPTSPTFNPYQ